MVTVFGIWIGNFRDILTDPARTTPSASSSGARFANGSGSWIAERLIPRITIRTRRVPLETHYYEVYQSGQCAAGSISRKRRSSSITSKGVKTHGPSTNVRPHHLCNRLDAITGCVRRIDIRGQGGIASRTNGRRSPTYLDCNRGLPNLLTLVVHTRRHICNIPPASSRMSTG